MKLSAEGITFSYGSRSVLDDVTFQVPEGQVTSIIGPNGSGKTTLIKCINKVLPPKKGSVMVDGQELLKMNRKNMAKILGYVPQITKEAFPLTVFETVLMGRKPHMGWKVSSKDLNTVSQVISQLGLTSLSERYLDELSGGQKQKVLLARALAQEPGIFLLDEPTSDLDIKNQLEVLQLVNKIAKENTSTIVMAIHDLHMAARFSDKVILLKEGEIYATGTPTEVLTEENLAVTYEVKTSIINTNSGIYVLPVEPINGG
ncbi:ABC transporter related [Natranaerobius thermophilus JW/NM-WN-LF]|uniref:ABC transporter related n=1 Tax=Natranaerobius thermophilus (strain ATCC BAA-1301 / DSM 18059 / JW/NM-WN-LF) TaxID=457570 RepID=B2A1X4_NATTJ|nr:ABC transporter related [Natranaerobius thermophilus JW/NM-WN-LF]